MGLYTVRAAMKGALAFAGATLAVGACTALANIVSDSLVPGYRAPERSSRALLEERRETGRSLQESEEAVAFDSGLHWFVQVSDIHLRKFEPERAER